MSNKNVINENNIEQREKKITTHYSKLSTLLLIPIIRVKLCAFFKKYTQGPRMGNYYLH